MRFTKMIAIASLLCLLLAGCAGEAGPTGASPEPTDGGNSPGEPSASPGAPALLTQEAYPKVDGSTATIPLSAALLSRACGIPLEEAELYVDHSTTSNAYQNLLNGLSDLLLVYEPPEGAHRYASDMGVALEEAIQMAPIGRDALVFLVNAANPVSTLGALQIEAIYRGEIVNWKDVGGEDRPIAAFQRDADSGSQTLMRKLAMKGQAMMEPEVDLIIGSMGEMMERIVDYDNGGGALGYSVYYYVQNMLDLPDVKMLAIDGVEPSQDSIAKGLYPFTNDFYAAIRADEPQDSPARKLFEWMISQEGRELLRQAGYVPIG